VTRTKRWVGYAEDVVVLAWRLLWLPPLLLLWGYVELRDWARGRMWWL
jgi:hypothetical protein